ncbi:TPA: hypothetical protein ACH3X2_013618 [Trebouxia sp. C0005]
MSAMQQLNDDDPAEEGSTSEYTEQDSEPQWVQDDSTAAGTHEFALPAQDQSSGGTSEKPIILITTVDIGEGRTDRITLREGDSPQDAALAFCQGHALDKGIAGPLARHIQGNLDRARHDALAQTQAAAAQQQLKRSQVDSTGVPMPASRVAKKAAQGARKPSFRAGSPEFLSSAEYRRAAAAQSQPYLYEPNRGSQAQPSTSESAPKGRSVYDRLYSQATENQAKLAEARRARDAETNLNAQASRHSMTWVSQELTKGRNNGEYSNYGERLYVEGMLEQEKKKAAAELAQDEREAAELAGITWQPEISKMAQTLQRPDADEDSFMRLTRTRTNKTQERLAMLKQQQEEAASRECTFHPVINHRSDRLMAERSEVLREHQIAAHEQLYQDAIRRRLRQEEMAHWFPEDVTFQPTLETGGHHADSTKVMADPTVNVSDRLYERRKKMEAKLAAVRAAAEHPVDPATGRPLFQPAIGRAPHHRRNQHGLPVGEYLYGMRFEFEDKKEYLNELSKQQFDLAATTHYTTGRSQTLMARLKAKRFSQIFNYLDQDQAGVIDLLDLATSEEGLMDTLDPEVRADVEAAAHVLAAHQPTPPASQDEEQGGKDADEEEDPQDSGFITKMFDKVATTGLGPSSLPTKVTPQHFQVLMEAALALTRGVPRAYLLPSPQQRQADAQLTFRPQITQKSKKLAERRRPRKANVYDQLHKDASVTSQKIQQKRQQRDQDTLKECTFQPAFVSERMAGQGRALKLAGTLAHFPAPSDYPDSPESHKYLQLEREVRQALAASSVGGSTPAGARLGALLEAHSSNSSPLTFASSQFSPSERRNSQGTEEGQPFKEDFAQRGNKLRNLSMRLDAAADQMSGDEWIRSHPDVQDMPEIMRWDEGSNEIIAEMLTGTAGDWAT